jgi:hypothetical protein
MDRDDPRRAGARNVGADHVTDVYDRFRVDTGAA